MPILNIKALPQNDSSKVRTALKKTCLAIAEFYQCQPSQVWATWEELKPGMYMEGDLSVDSQPQGTHPPIAQLTCFEGLTTDRIEKILELTASTLSSHLGLENNIFITYHEAKSGQVIAGDGIVRKQK